jgi:hypothetical protein
MANFWEHNSEPLGSKEGGKFLDHLSNYQPLTTNVELVQNISEGPLLCHVQFVLAALDSANRHIK